MDIRIRENVDNGEPTVAIDPEGDIAMSYRLIATRLAARLAQQAKDYASAFPNIVVQND